MYKNLLTFISACFLILIGCERKPLYLQGDTALKITVQAEADINTLWDVSWRDSLKYIWNEEVYGPMFYTEPTTCDVVIFNNGKLLNEVKIETNKSELIYIEPNKVYDLLIYSKDSQKTKTYYEGGRYYIETPPLNWKASKNEISKEYDTVEQPGEVFSVYEKQFYLPDDISEYEEVVEDGKLVYVYNIDAKIEPVSYIYIVQFVVINDDKGPIIEAKGINNFTISGIASKKNMFNNKPVYTGNKQILSFDIKPGQFQTTDTLVFASRVTILGLLPNDGTSSWSTQTDYLYYVNVDVDTYNYGVVMGTKDITKQLKRNPTGGIITITIRNSELKSVGPESNGFGVDVSEWEEHTFNVF